MHARHLTIPAAMFGAFVALQPAFAQQIEPPQRPRPVDPAAPVTKQEAPPTPADPAGQSAERERLARDRSATGDLNRDIPMPKPVPSIIAP